MGLQRVEPEISSDDVRLAARDIPRRRATGLDQLPAEFHKRCAVLRAAIAELFDRMVERDYVPKELGRFYTVPLDTAGKGPTKCRNKGSMALLSPLMKLLELASIGRLQTMLGGKPTVVQNAYQRARSAEILLTALDASVASNIRNG